MIGRLKYYGLPLLKIILFGVLIWLCSIPFSLLEFITFDSVHPLVLDIISELIWILIILAALLLVFRIFRYYHFEQVFMAKAEVFGGFVKGTGLGILLVSVSAAVAWLNGNVVFGRADFDPVFLMGYLLFYVLVGIAEELTFRTFPLAVLTERYQVWVGILMTSALFSLAHYLNPSFSWLAFLNISLVGCCLAMIVLIKGSIYWAIGIHFGWNYTQGVLLGYRVSGTESIGILNAAPKGHSWLSGGNFGIEGSIWCTLTMAILFFYLIIRHRSAIRPSQSGKGAPATSTL